MQYSMLNERSTPAVVSLWKTVFGDEDLFIRRCIDEFASGGFVMTTQNGEKTVATLLAAPCSFGKHNGVYFYALATDPQSRGAGVMSGLMQAAEAEAVKRGAAFSVLIPANEPLFAYYQKRGYSIELMLRRLEFSRRELSKQHGTPVTTQIPDAQTLENLRQTFLLAKYVAFSSPQSSFICEDMADEGMKITFSSTGYAVWLCEEERVLVPELAAVDETAARDLLWEVGRQCPEEHILASVPALSPLFAGCGNIKRAALIKPLQTEFCASDAYLRFALDDVPAGFA